MTAPERPLERVVKLIQRQGLALFQVSLHELVVELDDLIYDLGIGNADAREIGRLVGGLEEAVGNGLALAGGQVKGQTFLAERIADLAQHMLEICVFRVDLVDDDQAREAPFLGVLHHALRHELHAVIGADHHRGRFDCGQGA